MAGHSEVHTDDDKPTIKNVAALLASHGEGAVTSLAGAYRLNGKHETANALEGIKADWTTPVINELRTPLTTGGLLKRVGIVSLGVVGYELVASRADFPRLGLFDEKGDTGMTVSVKKR